tara:strand:- start:299 stop:820 length:522 start_codon:yes stop_codon:yes gene_type:complete
MSEVKPKTGRRIKRSDDATFIRFVEELGWLLESYGDVDFSALPNFIRQQQELRNRSTHLRSLSSQSDIASTLVGVLPSFFMDRKIFPSNVDLVEFAEQALGIETPRWQKKSKNELIGHIVCHANEAPPAKLRSLSKAIEDLVEDEGERRKNLERQRKSGRSWNEVIQDLVRNS